MTLRRTLPLGGGAVAACLLLTADPACGQAADTVHLGALQRAVEGVDPRAAQADLLAAQSTLRLELIGTERWPTILFQGQAQHLSDVTSFAGGGPLAPPAPYQTQYDAAVSLRQSLLDPTRAGRGRLERARLGQAAAQLRSTLWQQRQQVNDAYFTVLRLDTQRATLEAARADLNVQRRLAADRVTNGAALPSEVLLLDAEIARRGQALDELGANREAARAVLASLTGTSIDTGTVLAAPDLATAVATVRDALAADRSRPEYAAFDATRALIATQRNSATAAEKPRLAAIVRSGYGRPGLNQLSRDFDTYYQAGLQLEWSPWNWGATRRQQDVQVLQERVLATEEAAFAEQLARATTTTLLTIDQLERTLRSDDEILALRERVLRESRLRFAEGVTTAAEYVDRETDLLLARLDRDSHLTRLDETRARLLTTAGHEVP
jgi:outer membrane protein TolC